MDIVERLRDWGKFGVSRGDFVAYSHEAADEIERLRGMLISALDGLDEYWVTFPEGVELVNQIKALQQKEKE
jgi:hypothetical protein